MKIITISLGIDKTERKIIALAKGAEAIDESSVLAEIAGVLVTVHSKKFEREALLDLTPPKRFSFAELVENEI